MSRMSACAATGRIAAFSALAIVGMVGIGGPARADATLSVGMFALRDNQQYETQQYRAEWRRETDTSAQWIAARWYQYALDEYLGGVLSFSGTEPAAGAGAQWLRDLWWFALSAGFQGTADLKGAVGDVVAARALPAGEAVFTPRLEVTREPLGTHPLPLSMGLLSDRAQAALAWRSPRTLGEIGARVDHWEGGTLAGRAQNTALDRIDPTLIESGYGYVLHRAASWFQWGLSGRVARSTRNTLLATQVQPTYVYNWYPASAPPFAVESALVLQAKGHLTQSWEAGAELKLPVVSYEKRQWESTRVGYWGTAPLEAKVETTWWFFSTTGVQIAANLFDKPWERWQFGGVGEYRQISAQLSLNQRL